MDHVDPGAALRHATDNPNPAENKTVPKTWLSKLRRLPGWYALVKVVPIGARKWAKRRLLFKPVDGKPVWDPAVKRSVIEILREDTRKLLQYAGKPADYWKLD